ncbi:MAG: hypothetical protein ACK4VO_12485 [Pseudobdellovibrio sp.]
MKNTNKILISAFILFTTLQAFSHGEDKPGPHGGYIRMPGAFHTEVVPEKNGYRIYLLDIEWKNPTTKNSNLKASIKTQQKTLELDCKSERNSYFCKSQIITEPAQLILNAQRKTQKGSPATYDLPLRFTTTTQQQNNHQNMDHSNHH